MARTKCLQPAAIGKDRNSPPMTRTGMPAKPVVSLAKARKGTDRHHPSQKTARIAVDPFEPCGTNDAEYDLVPTMGADKVQVSASVLVQNLPPRQALAASLLASGKQGREVASIIGVSQETISRWRHTAEFDAAMCELLRESIDATRLGMIALTVRAINELHNLIGSFSDATSLKACSLVLGKAGPVLNVIGMQRPPDAAPKGND